MKLLRLGMHAVRTDMLMDTWCHTVGVTASQVMSAPLPLVTCGPWTILGSARRGTLHFRIVSQMLQCWLVQIAGKATHSMREPNRTVTVALTAELVCIFHIMAMGSRQSPRSVMMPVTPLNHQISPPHEQ